MDQVWALCHFSLNFKEELRVKGIFQFALGGDSRTAALTPTSWVVIRNYEEGLEKSLI